MTGVLLVQLGTPDAPTVPALRRYLAEFLGDPRVIEAPRWLWRLILHLYVLRFRPRQSAAKYQNIWDPATGSPLLHYTRRQAEALQKRLIVLPMYPQYSATTTASATDGLFKVLMQQRRVPALRIVPPYYAHPAYLDAVTTVVREQLARLPRPPEHYLLSFHGIPIRYAQRGDPYATHVKRTTAELIRRLGWPRAHWTQTFQSLFGREEWLKPYTDRTLVSLARRGIKRVFVATPGFTTDCLETIDEIGREAREAFQHAGGAELYRCPCLNDHPAWIEALRTLVLQEGQGWIG